MKKNRFLAVSILAVILLIVSFIRISDQESTGEYDAWCDINHDGKIDIKDIAIVAKKFGTLGDAIVGSAWQMVISNLEHSMGGKFSLMG